MRDSPNSSSEVAMLAREALSRSCSSRWSSRWVTGEGGGASSIRKTPNSWMTDSGDAVNCAMCLVMNWSRAEGTSGLVDGKQLPGWLEEQQERGQLQDERELAALQRSEELVQQQLERGHDAGGEGLSRRRRVEQLGVGSLDLVHRLIRRQQQVVGQQRRSLIKLGVELLQQGDDLDEHEGEVVRRDLGDIGDPERLQQPDHLDDGEGLLPLRGQLAELHQFERLGDAILEGVGVLKLGEAGLGKAVAEQRLQHLVHLDGREAGARGGAGENEEDRAGGGGTG